MSLPEKKKKNLVHEVFNLNKHKTAAVFGVNLRGRLQPADVKVYHEAQYVQIY